MRSRLSLMFGRLLPLVLAVVAGLIVDVDSAIAQGGSCRSLNAQLQQLDRNSSYRGLGGNQSELRQLQREVQRNESAYVRNGCNDLAKRGQTLPRDCKTLAKRITDGRQAVASLSQSASTGEAVAQQREAILQEMARFGCGGQAPQRQRRGNILDQLFNALTGSEYSDGDIVEEEWGSPSSYNTIRTVCVRKADGYYWPISYSTLTDYLYEDLQSCQAQCPQQEVDLYYYSNPGQEAEEMVNMNGEAYMALPNAFKYRQSFDPSITCKSPEAGTGILQVATDSNGQSTTVINLEGGVSVPLPRRDPRRPQATTIVAAAEPVTYVDAVHVPLPRKRPPGPGEAPVPTPQVVAKPAEAPASRVVEVAGKTVRIVGPDTPYARVGVASP